MNTYVQISSATTSSLVYVNFEIAGGKLKLQLLSGAKRGQKIELKLSELQHPQFDYYFGGRRWSFSYQDQTYEFLEAGFAVVEYIAKAIA